MLPVNEIFPTIQGEGRFTGTPAWFVRLQGCPVGCGWCDTKHTWTVDISRRQPWDAVVGKTEAPTDGYAYAEVPMLLREMCERPRIEHVVITGGEPCLYDLMPLTSTLIDMGHTVQVETSCTHEARVAPGTWITGSPKFDMPGLYPVLDSMLLQLNEVKMPVGKQSDIDRLVTDVKPKIRDRVQIWLQPLSQSKAATALCVEAALEHGFRVSAQTHKYLGLR